MYERKEKLDKIALLMSEGCSENSVFEVVGISRSSYYRWQKNYALFGLAGLEPSSKRPNNTRKTTWTFKTETNVYHLRKQYPLWGKQKIAVMYKRMHGITISHSTIGRILTKLLREKKIMPVRFMFGKKDTKKRAFTGHAQRWKYGMKAQQAGELIQVDHTTTMVEGVSQIKHFSAICPTTKYMVNQAYKEATSTNATDFLQRMKEQLPFPILSIQVDGGSEFMAYFEEACYKAKIPLWVLPPRRPELNGGVERSNLTVKNEFYAQYELHSNLFMLRKNLQKFTYFYNSVRPHQGIGLLTPREFYEVISRRT